MRVLLCMLLNGAALMASDAHGLPSVPAYDQVWLDAVPYSVTQARGVTIGKLSHILYALEDGQLTPEEAAEILTKLAASMAGSNRYASLPAEYRLEIQNQQKLVQDAIDMMQVPDFSMMRQTRSGGKAPQGKRRQRKEKSTHAKAASDPDEIRNLPYVRVWRGEDPNKAARLTRDTLYWFDRTLKEEPDLLKDIQMRRDIMIEEMAASDLYPRLSERQTQEIERYNNRLDAAIRARILRNG